MVGFLAKIATQCDQMSLRQKSPKMLPNPFFVKIITKYFTVDVDLGYFCNFLAAHSKQSSKGKNSANQVTLNLPAPPIVVAVKKNRLESML
jgi:hypothetical protein